jgi:hypothetical protein
MVNYQNSKIYKIWSPQTDKIYIGSTVKLLCRRMADHKSDYKAYLEGRQHFISSYKLIELSDCAIELIENYSCNSREELNKREGEIIRQNKDNCVNYQIAGRTKLQWRNDNNERRFVKYNCSCGSTLRKEDKARHERTNKHKAWVENQNQM